MPLHFETISCFCHVNWLCGLNPEVDLCHLNWFCEMKFDTLLQYESSATFQATQILKDDIIFG